MASVAAIVGSFFLQVGLGGQPLHGPLLQGGLVHMMIDDDILDTEDHDHEAHLQLQLGPPPVSPLGIVPNGVARPHSD